MDGMKVLIPSISVGGAPRAPHFKVRPERGQKHLEPDLVGEG